MHSKLVLFLVYILAIAGTMALPLQRREYTGEGTFYTVGLGSCGQTNSDSENVAALSSSLMSDGKNCGRSLTVTSGSKSVTVKAVDTCPSCPEGNVDLSPSAFKKLADLDEGRISITWDWN
ncbi:RlpA-like double-psi beta-barrel-protein domain-containing protein-containing protein [Fennellomyces sp. T-0311]|nr:RlpA-like double-psi beta-barrel-protein domain-containing protein-containing protein [Fennellomyces sp. T-0311]